MGNILCIIDGMTDSGFQVEDYPTLSSMCLSEYVDTTLGQEPESLGCILRLLGIRDVPPYLRGYAEALGHGISVESDDLILRGSWFGLDDRGCCTIPVSPPPTIPESRHYRDHPLGEYKSLLILPGMASSISRITTFPPYQYTGQPVEQLCPQGCPELSRIFTERLEHDRCFIPWGQSIPANLPPFPQSAAVICGTPIVKGIAKLLGMTVIPVTGATGDVDTDVCAKGKAALEAAKTFSFVLLHLNGADEASHRKNPSEKRDFLRKVDALLLPTLLNSGHEIHVVADHGTDPRTGQHLAEKQPLFLHIPNNPVRSESTKSPLAALIASVAPLNQTAMEDARRRQGQLAKPPGSLGRLEDFSVQLAGITETIHNQMKQKHLLVFASDNGVVDEGVSSAPQSVTLMQTINLTRAKTGASVLAKQFGVSLTVCDVGVNADIPDRAVLNRKIAYGTQNIAREPAMSREQAITAILTGAELAQQTHADVIGVGEMGIGNTTTSSAVLSVLLDVDVEAVTGRGGGLTEDSFSRKKAVIRQAIAINQPNRQDVVDVLAKVGGFDLAAMCGAFLGTAATHRPVVIDGFISAVAALCAVRLCPNVRDYLIPSHASYEIGYKRAMEAMNLEPIFLLNMRLGEGSGCPLAFEVLNAACAILNDMETFEEAGIDDRYLEEIRPGDSFAVEGLL